MRHFGYRRNYEVAKYFDVTPQTLSGWIKSGEIPPKHLMKYTSEIEANNKSDFITNKIELNQNDLKTSLGGHRLNYSAIKLKKLFTHNIKYFIFIPFITVSLVTLYVFLIADKIYTSKSKVLPISEDGGSSNSFSGFASQLGINIPLSIGGKVPWDEIYPEIVKSSDLLKSILKNEYVTEKYGNSSLENIMINEYSLNNYNKQDRENRVLDKFKEMIKISKDRSSPIVNIHISTFEPNLAAEISKDLIKESSLIQRQLKTNRVRKKRLFIEERLEQVSLDMKNMETELREFRENNRNLSSSPTLTMKLQEMGRELDLQNSLYVTLKTQYEKAKIDEIGRDDMVQQIDGPSIPTNLTSPKRSFSILMSIFISFFLSTFLAYAKEDFIS